MRRFAVPRASWLLSYAVAVLTVALAAAARLSLARVFGTRNELLTFYPAVVVSAWYGGLWPGVFATAVAALFDAYVFMEPLQSLWLGRPGDVVALTLFVGMGVVISMLSENQRQNVRREHAARVQAEQLRAEADAANRTKNLFLGVVSHDLRSPANAILGWAEVLKKTRQDRAQSQHALDAIVRNARRQMILLNDLLDTAAILAGQLHVERTTVDLGAVVRDAVDSAQVTAAEKGIRVSVTCPGEPLLAPGDATRLQQVVSNLLSNAIKFTPEGGGVFVSLERVGDLGEIRVRDTGKGISPELLSVVFDAFWQAEHRSQHGVGLGLSIVKSLVAAHGGTVEASSAGEGRGATFVVRLPLGAGSSVIDSDTEVGQLALSHAVSRQRPEDHRQTATRSGD
jgi:signal transduction histidine kinase